MVNKETLRKAPILAVVAGSGQVAKHSLEAGADLLLALNAGAYRNQGHGSLAAFLPFGNANDQTRHLLREQILPVANSIPVVAGVLAGDESNPTQVLLEEYRKLGVRGITNWPATGFVDGLFRKHLESKGLDARAELEMLSTAQHMGFETYGFVYNAEEAQTFADAGVDVLILHIGLTRQPEDVREGRDQLQLAISKVNEMLGAARKSRNAPLCLAFGGVVTEPEDLDQLLRYCPLDGFAGGSVFERLPVEGVLHSTVRRFKSALVRPDPGEKGLGQMLGHSASMQDLFQLVKRIAPFDVNVCVEGESGVGKELVAIQIHKHHPHRSNHPFVTLNCGAIPDSLLESELFGHEKGAFTGADRRRLGKFELAQHGTLFLDEIADLSPHGQVALLRAIQQREITRVGGELPLPVDVRIIAASNQSLRKGVEQGKFRADLYHRLNNVTIPIPPLRERLDDLPILIEDILARLQVQLGRKLTGVSDRFLAKLRIHFWSGNVRELQHVISQTALLEDGMMLEGKRFDPQLSKESSPESENSAQPGAAPFRQSRRSMAQRAMQEHDGNKSQAASALGVTRKTLYAWLASESEKSK